MTVSAESSRNGVDVGGPNYLDKNKNLSLMFLHFMTVEVIIYRRTASIMALGFSSASTVHLLM